MRCVLSCSAPVEAESGAGGHAGAMGTRGGVKRGRRSGREGKVAWESGKTEAMTLN